MIVPYTVLESSMKSIPKTLSDAGFVDSLDNYFTGNLDYQRELENLNIQNLYNSAEAQKNRDFQSSMYEIERLYNSAEAQKNRDFQELMSSTAYQRAVEDMKKAGLNPYMLYSNGGAGASTPSGSVASANAPTGSSARSGTPHSSTRASQGIGSLLNAIVSLIGTAGSLASAGLTSSSRLASSLVSSATKLETANIPRVVFHRKW